MHLKYTNENYERYFRKKNNGLGLLVKLNETFMEAERIGEFCKNRLCGTLNNKQLKYMYSMF